MLFFKHKFLISLSLFILVIFFVHTHAEYSEDKAYKWKIVLTADDTQPIIQNGDKVTINYEIKLTPSYVQSKNIISGSDECVTVNINSSNVDIKDKQICVGDLDKTIQFSEAIGKDNFTADMPLNCGMNTVSRIANFVTNDTHSTDQSSINIYPQIDCPIVCKIN